MTNKKKQNDSIFEVKWAVLCQNAVVDQQTNNLSLHNIVEELTFNKDPLSSTAVKHSASFPDKTSVKFNSTLVVYMERKYEIQGNTFNPEMEIKIVDPKNDILGTNILPINFETGKNRLRMLISFESVLVKDPGIYNFVISARDSKEGKFKQSTTVSIDVKIYE